MTHIQDLIHTLEHYKKNKPLEEIKIKFTLQDKATVKKELIANTRKKWKGLKLILGNYGCVGEFGKLNRLPGYQLNEWEKSKIYMSKRSYAPPAGMHHY